VKADVSRSRRKKTALAVDPHPAILMAIRELIYKLGYMLCAQANDLESAKQKIERHRPDLVITELVLPGGSGLDLVRWLNQERRRTPALVFSALDADPYCDWALEAGARGFVSKGSPTRELLGAVRKVAAGGTYRSGPTPARIRTGTAAFRFDCDRIPSETLSERELEVFAFVGQGYGAREIGKRLGISAQAIRTIQTICRRKLGARDSLDLARMAALWVAMDGSGTASRSFKVRIKARRQRGGIRSRELTPRQADIFRLIGAGTAPRQIARKLNLSLKTVEAHRENIRRKLGLESAAQVLREAVIWTGASTR